MTRNTSVTQQGEGGNDARADQAAGDRIFDRREAFLITNERKQLVEHFYNPLFVNLD